MAKGETPSRPVRREDPDENRRNNDEHPLDTAALILGGIAGVAAVAGGICFMVKSLQDAERQSRLGMLEDAPARARPRPEIMELPPSSSLSEDERYSRQARIRGTPSHPPVKNLDTLLHAIYVKHIAIKFDEFSRNYNVFRTVLYDLHNKMKSVDSYYERYSSVLSFAGSHSDNTRIDKPDEFNMDIVIRMPINYQIDKYNPEDSDINFETQGAGYVQLKMGSQFQQMPFRDGEAWLINKTAYKWMDDGKYLLRSKFLDWFKGVVARALNQYDTDWQSRPVHKIDGVDYAIKMRWSEKGPAITLTIENEDSDFKVDFDLVPALRFPETRWPVNDSYREIPDDCERGFWMVVPKPNFDTDSSSGKRSWRFALQNQEDLLIHDKYNLKQTLRLMKKFRDNKGMTALASYYIKTLFLWEVVHREETPDFWRESVGKLFIIMVKRLNEALEQEAIPYFWNENNNLLGHANKNVLREYRKIVNQLVDVLDDPSNYMAVANFLLTPNEARQIA